MKKTVVLSFFVFAAALTGLIYLLRAETPKKGPPIVLNSENTAAESGNSLVDVSSDSDQDGLKDWEEALWHSDPHKADTDGDGTPDGEEVKEGRDPAKAGPNDILFPQKPASSSQNADSNTDWYTLKLQTDNPAAKNPAEPAQTKGSAAAQQTAVAPAATELHAFGNVLGSLLKHYASEGQSEHDIFQGLIKNPTGAAFDGLDLVAQKYARLAAAIAAIAAPETAKSQKNSLVKAYNDESAAIKSLENYKSAGQIPTDAFKNYNTTVVASRDALVYLSLFFKNQNESWKPPEDGYFFSEIAAGIELMQNAKH